MKRLIAAVVILVMLAPVVVNAEGEVIKYYLLPVQVINDVYRGPAYLHWRFNPAGLDVQWSCKDYGSINVMVCAVDAIEADHTWLAAQLDVYAFPANLDLTPSPAELSALETALEASYIPADWLSPSETWRDALRTVTAMFLLMQRLTAITNSSPLEWGVTLNTQFRNLEQPYQDAISQAFVDLGYDDSVIKSNWTLRIILKNAADQWGETPILFGFTTL